jgi:uncharacterized phage protein gp47/JayE
VTFTPESYSDIVQTLVNWITSQGSITPLAPDMDLTVGSIEESHLEVLATQFESLEVRMAEAILDAIQDSCFHAFGFDQLPAVAATGGVVFSALTAPTVNLTIPSGTRLVSSTGQAFATTADAVLQAGSTTTNPVFIQADETGSAGNVAAGSITTMVSPILGVDLVTNPQPTLGGGDPESDESRAQRFTQYVQTLQRGTAQALEYAVTTNTAASLARVIEPFNLNPVPANIPYAGVVWLFAYDGSTGGLESSTASQIAQMVNGYVDQNGNAIPGWKAAGVQVTVLPAQVVDVSVRGTVTLTPTGGGRWDEIQANLLAAATAYFATLRIGDVACYQTLAAALNTCDPDIVSCTLQAWVDSTVVPGATLGSTPQIVPGAGVPGYPVPLGTVVPLAQDIDPTNATINPAAANNTYVSGSVCVLNQATETINGAQITYPEWTLA